MVLAASLLSAHPNWMNGGWVHGLMVAAVAVVAQAVLGLQRKLAPDRQRASLMVASAVLVLLIPRVWAQLLALLLGGLVRADAARAGAIGTATPRGSAAALGGVGLACRRWAAGGGPALVVG